MNRITEVEMMTAAAREARREGKRIGFVPTMGYFHEGHLRLMDHARRENDIVVVSLFVNPTQFGPGEDLESYPRDLDGDAVKAGEAGVDILFHPGPESLYSSGFSTWVEVTGLTDKLCGRARPGHFRGVATVVSKLFHIVQPHRAYFGLKDYQQYQVIRRMAADLNWDLEVVGVETVREPDGLAMSSRNVYLSPEQRQSALALSRSLVRAREWVAGGERGAQAILEMVRETISTQPETKIDYISLCDPLTLEEVDRVREVALLAVAVFVGTTRLIDNVILKAP